MILEKQTDNTDMRTTFCPAASLMRAAQALTLVLCSLLISAGFAQAQSVHGVVGYVYTRSLVHGENGKPILVEYHEDGSVAAEHGEMIDELDGARIISASLFKAYIESFNTFKQQTQNTSGVGAFILTRNAYNSTTFETINGQVVNNKPSLRSDTISAYVRGSRTLLSPNTNPLLFESPINLSLYAGGTGLNSNTKSIVLSDSGEVLRESQYNFGYRTAYGQTGEGECTEDNAIAPEEDSALINVHYGDERPCGPIAGATISSYDWYIGDVYTATDTTGRFYLRVNNPSCPGFSFEYTNYIFARLEYSNFNPLRRSMNPGFNEMRQAYNYCIGGHFLAPQLTSFSSSRVRFPIDVVALTGKGDISNRGFRGQSNDVVPIGEETLHTTNLPVFTEQIPVAMDIDGDGLTDQAVLHEDEVYVYLGGRLPETDTDGNPINEDLRRQPDFLTDSGLPDVEHQGLLSQISREDLEQTDLYVYRASNDQRVGELRGLNHTTITNGVGDDSSWFYAMHLATGFNSEARRQIGWRSEATVDDGKLERDFDHLRVGETLRLIAINRKSGYMGTALTELKAAQAGRIDFPVPDIQLRPPNLKITAERQYQVEAGLTEGETRNYIIGFEGAGLRSDDFIAITTEWFDYDGTPLPNDLPGYTGRLAQIVAENQLGDSQVGHFAIEPGRHLQMVALNGTDIQNKHYYVHVSGTPVDENPDFSTIGAGDGVLEYRPKYYTPFLVPIYSDTHNTVAMNNYRQLKQMFDAGLIDEEPVKPAVAHIMAYRPEMQFSVFELGNIELQYEDSREVVQTLDLTTSDSMQILADIDTVDLFYDVLYSDIAPLQSFGAGLDLVLRLGEEELAFTVGSNQQVTFENPEHLSYLAPEDFLNIQLYANNDAGNILWEYAFDLVPQVAFSKTWMRSRFESDITPTTTIGSLRRFNVSLDTPSNVRVDLLDEDRNYASNLISSTSIPAINHSFVVIREDLDSFTKLAGRPDLYIRVTSTPIDGSQPTVKLYEIELDDHSTGDMLGQIIQHDTLIQRGALSLRREDMALTGAGPQLNFIRSFTNEQKPENEVRALGPGWSHNHDIFVKVLAWADPSPSYGNNLPGWVGSTRNTLGPRLLDSGTMDALSTTPKIPSIVSVSNGGSFKWDAIRNEWSPQRGNHGTLQRLSDSSWSYRSKDGTVYSFATVGNDGKTLVDTITDRNGNRLTYTYTNIFGRQLVSNIEDQVGRTLDFNYDTSNHFAVRLEQVVSSVGIDLDFSYHPPAPAGDPWDPRTGMLQTFTRDDFSESYDYDLAEGDDLANLTTITDANGHEMRYEYFAHGDAPVSMEHFVPGVVLTDIVQKVHYPQVGSTTQEASAEFVYPANTSSNTRDIIDLRGNTTHYVLNEVGNPIRLEEPLGKITTFQWSSDLGEADNVLRFKREEHIDAGWEYQYDSKGNMTLEVDPYGETTAQTWDQGFSVLLTRTDKNGNLFEQRLDNNGNVVQERQTATVEGTEEITITRHAYGSMGNARGLRLSTTDARSHQTQFDYDGYGNLATITAALNTVTRYVNNDRGLRLSETDPSGNQTTYAYDNLDRLTLITDDEGNTTRYSYDNKGNKLSEETRDRYLIDTTSHVRLLTLDYVYDARDRVSTITRTGNLDASYLISGVKTYGYDLNSNLASETDWKGAATSYQYDALNRRTRTTNRNGHSMTYGYVFDSSSGLNKTITDYESRVAEERFDKLNRKIRVIHPEVTNSDNTTGNYERIISYDKLANVISILDENGHLTQFDYDKRYLKVGQTNALGDTYTWHYDEMGNVIETIDEEGRSTTFEYDELNRLTLKAAPEDQNTRYSYFPNGTLQTETDPWGFAYSYTYNGINQRTSVTYPDGTALESYTKDGQLVFQRDAEGRTQTNLIGPDGRLQVATDARGRTTTNTYDNNNNVTHSVLAWNDAATGPSAVTTRTEYDALDRVQFVHVADGTLNSRTTEYRYDRLGNRTHEINPNGREIVFDYDELNRVIRTQTAAVDSLNRISLQKFDGLGNRVSITDRRGNETTTSYDDLNRPVLITDPDGDTIRFTYDNVGNALTETNKRGITTETVYDDLNRVTERYINDNLGTRFRLAANEYDIGMPSGNGIAVIDANGNRVVSSLDWRGNVLTTALPAGTGYSIGTITNVYDNSGFLTSSTDAANKISRYSYFADGTLATSTNPENEATSYTYDLFANKATITKPKGPSYVQTLTYDERNRLVLVTDAEGSETRFEYDVNSNLVYQDLPAAEATGSNRVEYTYDALNRKRSHIQHKAGASLVTTYVYDAEGNLTQTTDASGQVFTHTYDNLNRLATQTFPVGSDITRITTTYDANGNIDALTEAKPSGDEVYSHEYDLLDRLTRKTQRGHVVNYTYDNNGNRTGVTSPGGSTSYTFDSRNRLSTVVAGGTTTYSYLQNGWLNDVAHANGTTATYLYDNAGRVTSITNNLNGGGLLSSFAYQYDDNGNRTQQIETQNGFADAQVLTTTYVYDELDRLESYSQTDGGSYSQSTAYTYFPSYDRHTETVIENNVTLKDRTYSYDETYWLTGITETAGLGGSIAYTYDANGNSVTKIDSTSGSTVSSLFSYNSRNQLKEVAVGALGLEASQGTHEYDYSGMRIRHLNSERGDIEYIYDDSSIIDELENNTTTQVAHYRYGDRLLSLNASGGDQFYHYASLGTTANLSDSAGQNQVAYRTDPYGKITRQEGSSVNRQVFTGQEHDENTGLIYFGARFYDPDTARFINQDTYLGESNTPPSLHRYLYAYANPTVYIDPDGNKSIFGEATHQIEEFKDWLGEQNKEADSQLAAAAIGTAQFVTTLGEGITRPLDIAANLAQVATGVDDQQVRDELAGTKQFIEGAADFVVNGDYAQAAKNVHSAAVAETVKAMEGDVTATANVTQAVLAVATLKSATKGKPKITKESSSGPATTTASSTVADEIAALRKIKSNAANSQRLNQKINLRGEVRAEYQRLLDEGASFKSLGPALAGAKDLKTGNTFFGVNHRTGLQPSVQSPEIPFKAIPDDVLQSYIKTKGAGSHAEVNALNSGLLSRQGAQQSDFILEVINAGGSKTTRGNRIPRCPHCKYLTDGAEFPLEPPKVKGGN